MFRKMGNKKNLPREAVTSETNLLVTSEANLLLQLHNKDRNNIENHKMKEEKNDRNGSE